MLEHVCVRFTSIYGVPPYLAYGMLLGSQGAINHTGCFETPIVRHGKMIHSSMQLLSIVVALVYSFIHVRGVTVDQYEILVREPPSQHSGDSYDLFGYTAVLHNRINPVAGTPFNDIVNNAR